MRIIMTQHLLFDLDGTLTDSGPGITRSAQYALRALGIEAEDPDALGYFVGPPLSEVFGEQHGVTGERLTLAVEKFREYFAAEGIHQNTVYPGIADMLTTLKAAGRQLYVATTKPLLLAHEVLGMFGLENYFVAVAGSPEGHVGLPKGEVIETLLRAQGLNPAHAIMVGDRRHDVAGAKTHGMRCVGVLYGYGSRDELQDAGADYLAETPAALTSLLLGL